MILSFKTYLEQINECLIKSYDIDFVIDKGSQHISVLNIPFNILKLTNNSIKLNLLNFKKVNIDHLFNLLNSTFTNLLGWFPSYMFITNFSEMKNQMNYDENYLKNTYEYLTDVSIIYAIK